MTKKKIHETANVAYAAQIGEGTSIWQNCIIQDDVVIGDNCNIGANVFIEKDVRIGNNVKVKNNIAIYTGVIIEDDVFLGPSCVFTNVINPRAFIPRKTEFKKTIIGHGATIGAHNVDDYALVVGNPDRKIGYVCECGCRLDERFKCTECGREYEDLCITSKAPHPRNIAYSKIRIWHKIKTITLISERRAA